MAPPSAETLEALSKVRDPTYYEWYVIFILVTVLFLYMKEIGKRNWKGVASGMMLYMIHWFVEIINSLICTFSGNALWAVPGGTAYLIMVGVCIEISCMFAISALGTSFILPENKDMKILGINNRWFLGILTAFAAGMLEIFLVATGTFYWYYPWWNAVTVWIIIYIPFFVGANLAFDWEPGKQKKVIGSLALVNIVMLCIFVPLGWI